MKFMDRTVVTTVKLLMLTLVLTLVAMAGVKSASGEELRREDPVMAEVDVNDVLALMLGAIACGHLYHDEDTEADRLATVRLCVNEPFGSRFMWALGKAVLEELEQRRQDEAVLEGL